MPLDFCAALSAAQVRAQHGLKPPDSLIIGTGIAVGVDAIVTNDGKWKRTLPISVVTLKRLYNVAPLSAEAQAQRHLRLPTRIPRALGRKVVY